MGRLVETGSKYADVDRRKAVALYMTLATNTAVAKEIGCYQSTISRWRRTDWWDEESARLYQDMGDEYRATLRQIVLEGVKRASACIKDGSVSGKDSMVISGIAYDKLRLSENRPTTISGASKGIQSKLDELIKRTQELEHQANAKLVSPPTSGPES